MDDHCHTYSGNRPGGEPCPAPPGQEMGVCPGWEAEDLGVGSGAG